ncbi:translocation/assembly module TamB domain-containing protein [Rhizobium sp. 18065]|uniref:translocation/assembly module TamB domain-containing protein n=1 Tax=Rhizobium sp. 18065 TaxID=2681411 RepID=UPI00135B8230|nr:translocation/assembly module TamB domain-containing protein [Rhizobium sp. 18065]
MIWLKRIIGWTLRIFAGLVATLVTLTILVIVIGGLSASGSQFLANQIAALISKDNQQISIVAPSPLLSQTLTVERITVADTKGPYATIEGLALDWTPLDLLSRRFTADKLSARSIRIDRAPEPSATPVVKSDEPFSLPVGIDIAAIDLPSIKVGAALARRDVEIAAKGAAQIIGSNITSQLTATLLGEPSADLAADVLYAPDDDRLRLKLDYAEPKGGVAGNLLQLPDQPAVAFSIDGDGAISNWAGKITAALDGRQTVSVDATHRLAAEDQRDITLIGGGNFASLMPPQLRDLFAGETSIDLAARIAPDGAIEISKGELSTAAARISASGHYDPKGINDLALVAEANATPVRLQWQQDKAIYGVAVRRANLTLSGNAQTAALKAAIDLATLSSPQGTLSDIGLTAESSAFDIANRQGPVDLQLAVQSAEFFDAQLANYIRAPLKIVAPLTIEEDAVATDRLTLESAGIGGELNGRYVISAQTFTGALKAFVLPDLLPPALAEKLTKPVALSTRIDFAAPKAVSLRDIQLQTDLGSAEGAVSLAPDGILAADLTGRLNDVASFQPRISGGAAFDVSASGPLDAIEGNVNVVIEEGKAAGYDLRDLSLQIEGLADQNAPRGQLRLTGQIDAQPVDISADVVSENGATKIPALTLNVGENRLSGSLALDEAFQPTGDLSFDFPQLSLLAALGGQSASGDLAGTIAITSADSRIAARIDASGKALSRDTLQIENPAIDLAISDVAALAVEGIVRAAAIVSGTNRIEAPEVTFARAGARTDFQARAQYDAAPLEAAGSMEQQPQGLAIALDRFSAKPRGIALALAAPARLTVTDGTVQIGKTVINAGSGNVTVTGSAGQTLAIRADIAALPASLAAAVAPAMAPAGTISGVVEVKGTSSAPDVTYQLDWRDAEVAQTRTAGLAPLAISANGRFQNNTLSLDTRLSGDGGITLNGGGRLGVSGMGLDMRFQGSLPLAAANTVLGQQGLVAQGNANVNVTLQGTATAPAIAGSITTSGARVVDVRRNLAVEQIAATINLRDNRAQIASLTGNFASGGRVSASGSIDILGQGMPADLTINLDKAVYVDGNTVTATADARLTLRGPLMAGPTLAGTVDLSRTSITLSERRPTSLSQLDIQHRNAPKAVTQQLRTITPAAGRSSSSPILLDLRISSPSQTFIRGRGIDAELGGTLTLTGSASAPNVSGGFELRRGRMQILTKRLDITRAEITFGGDLIPIIDLEATTTSGSSTVTIKLYGFASDPEVTFSSSPTLPQDEILAQLIFGQSMSRLSALQIAQLADAAAQLAGGNSTSLFQTLRSTLGIDDLDISTDSTGQTSISAGKYLNDRTYIELQQSGSGGGKAVINLDIGRGVKLKGEAGGSGAGGGIYYEKEY